MVLPLIVPEIPAPPLSGTVLLLFLIPPVNPALNQFAPYRKKQGFDFPPFQITENRFGKYCGQCLAVCTVYLYIDIKYSIICQRQARLVGERLTIRGNNE